MSDGVRLRKTWSNALDEAESHFRRLLTSPFAEWKRVVTPSDAPSGNYKSKARISNIPELSDVVLHRKSSKSSGDIYRITLEVPTGDEIVTLEPWKAVLGTPELRQEWDPAVEASHLVEMFDNRTRICMTKFTLGWPANPRDAVTIARSFHDASTLIDISTSLPRSLDEPVYLRPSPPYVRSHITLFAWCVQYISPPPQSQQQALQPAEVPKRKASHSARVRITSFWQHDLRAVWNLGSSSSLPQQLCTMVLGLFKTVMKRGSRIPVLCGYGHGISIERIRFQIDREALTVEYAILPEEDENTMLDEHNQKGIDKLTAKRESRRLVRSIECILPASEGWDVQLTTKASSAQVEKLPWVAKAVKNSINSLSPSTSQQLDQIILRLTHSPLLDDHSVLKVKLTVELSATPSGLRLNGLPHVVEDVEERNPSSLYTTESIFQEVGSTADLSFHSASSIRTAESGTSNLSSTTSVRPQPLRAPTERSAVAEKSVLSRVRRNYIYFSSLLQEPEAKWKRTTEARGVGITQLDSIDPTLVVYRAEATFLGVGLWDLYAALVSPGARAFWDKQHDDAVLLEDVNELTELWHIKTKPAWPVVGRDSVVLKTVYKSPTAIHVFSFSADEPHLFPSIPPVEAGIIRTQVDLQGWAIESLSPTTTLLTLLEQSDPKGWSNKASIPQQMINAVAGVGEFAIKCGGPPVMTRLAGAKANEIRYDHERGSFRVEYEGAAKRRASAPLDASSSQSSSSAMQMPVIECELRCDIDVWASSLDIVVDPPPQSITCLRRHRLSDGGGGLWLTMTHDAVFVDDERLLAIVRRGPGREKGVVMLNGAKVTIDVEELSEAEIKSLSKRKRNKPARIPLDQPPVVGVIRRRRAEWTDDTDANGRTTPESASSRTAFGWASAPRFSSPLARFLTSAVEQATSTTQQAVAAISTGATAEPLSPSKSPMQYALEALSWLQETHCRYVSDSWTLLSEKGLAVHRKLAPEISTVIPVHRCQKVIEGVSAEELSSIVTQHDCRKHWDDRFDSATAFEAYGADCFTSFVVSKSAFPFRDRGFYLASVMARGPPSGSQSRRNTADLEQLSGGRNTIFCVSASFSADCIAAFSQITYNPHMLPIGRVFVDGWILETLDPYTTENYAIPSTRCTRLVAVDYAGSIPTAVNSMINAALPMSVLSLEAYAKTISPLPATRLPSPGLVILDNKSEDDFVPAAWKLRRRDENRVLIATKYASEGRTYRSSLLLMMPAPATRAPTINPDDVTPRPSTMSLKDPTEMSSTPPDESTVTTLAAPTARRRKMSANSTMTNLPSRDVTPSPSKGLSSMPSRSPSSSVFTVRGELRHWSDLLVAEIVVDSRLYPDGYHVQIMSHIRDKGKRISLSAPEKGQSVLPISCTIHTLPVSGLHSSGLNADKPTRHLLRLFLPTAPYQICTVVDPLTGETRAPPPKPPWLVGLQETGAVVNVEIKPAISGSKGVVSVDGQEMHVANEKESLTSLGREELLDDRMSKMAVITRSTEESDLKSEELTVPIAVAEYLLESTSVTTSPLTDTGAKDAEQVNTASDGSEDIRSIQVPPRSEIEVAQGGSSRFLGFFQSYPNPLSRFGVSPHASTSSSTTSSRRASGSQNAPPGGLTRVDNVSTSSASTTGFAAHPYPLSTVIIVGLISFLVGSLLRSLLSPADFIYVVSDIKEGQGLTSGWREIKRLLEVKYIAGGWDFQVAVVRRH